MVKEADHEYVDSVCMWVFGGVDLQPRKRAAVAERAGGYGAGDTVDMADRAKVLGVGVAGRSSRERAVKVKWYYEWRF